MSMNWRKLFATGGFVAALCLSGPAPGQTVTLKMAHQWPQDESDYVIATAVKFAKEVERQSNGQIKINIFPAESLVKAAATHTALKGGTVDLAVYPYIYAAGAIPEMNLILLPGVWKTHDDVYGFRTSAPWKRLEQKAEAFGFKTLAWIQIAGGIASIKKPILTSRDLDGLKVRGAGKMMEAALQKAGASTVSVTSPETYNALQLGLVDAVWTSSSTFASLRLYEVSKYYTSPDERSTFFTIEPICISMKTWNKLTPGQQKILSNVGASLEASALEGAKAEDQRVTRLFADHGVKVQQMSLVAWEQWQKLYQEIAFRKFRQEIPGGDQLLNETLSLYK